KRAVDLHWLAVDQAQRHPRGPRAVAGFVGRMHAAAQVAGGDHRGERVTQDLDMILAVEPGLGWRHLRRQRGELVRLVRNRVGRVPGPAAAAGLLDVEEREVALAPVLAPAADEGAHERVLIDAGDRRAALALVPEDATDAERNEGADVRFVEVADLAGRFA